MVEIDFIQLITNQGFAIAVAVYLLFERSKFNEKITQNLTRIVEALERIEQMHALDEQVQKFIDRRVYANGKNG